MTEVVIQNWPSQSIKIKLKPCSCGSSNIGEQGGGSVWIECNDCGECGPENGTYSGSIRRAAEDWNTKKHGVPSRNRKKSEWAKRAGRRSS